MGMGSVNSTTEKMKEKKIFSFFALASSAASVTDY
jgi:hypothetical protein